jgi:hypothetical protein
VGNETELLVLEKYPKLNITKNLADKQGSFTWIVDGSSRNEYLYSEMHFLDIARIS